MSQPAYNLRPRVDSPTFVEPALRPAVEPEEDALEIDDAENDPYYYEDLLKIYGPLGVEDYVTIRPIGLYPEGPFELRGWRRDPQTEQLVPIAPDQQGRIQSQAMGLLFGTGAGGLDLAIWDAATGERLRTWDEEAAWLAERAERVKKRIKQEATAPRGAEERIERAAARRAAEKRAETAAERAEQDEAARRAAEKRAEQDEATRRAVEEENRAMCAEIERLRALLQEREEGDTR